MLINFRVENFLSFDQVSTFSMTTGKTKLHQKNIIKTKEINEAYDPILFTSPSIYLEMERVLMAKF